MKKIVFTEEFCNPGQLFPITLTRQIQDIRIGILTIRQKWETHLGLSSADKFEDDYKDLDNAINISKAIGSDTYYLVHGNVLPTKEIVRQVKKLKAGEALSISGLESFVYCITKNEIIDENKIKVARAIELNEPLVEIKNPWHIFQHNAFAIAQDFELLTNKKRTQKISNTNRLVKPEKIFLEKGAVVEHCFINASEGPVYIGKNALLMEGAMLRGPISVGEGAVVKMGAKIYGSTSIGPYSTVGGEIKNSVMFGYSNKAHDGYMGDAVIGEWCNWGAGTSNSNIKNNASGVEVWTPAGAINVGTKCGVIMGDYSRTAINTSINTGTVIGACANVFGSGLTPKYIPSFAWGNEGISRYKMEKAFDDINNWKLLKGSTISANEKIILKHIFDHY